ncbi:type I restriction enzyme, S subunit [Candidatus Pantoea symbiotica]|jgi:type I restriction enzyme S subunit|uniref:Type I restriction enzyme, S subunit n=1 Tax=Candidatus Pantoea symbiotica TaxID=1884370 RepID=A0A1I4AW95_9GAMM|nr:MULTISPECIES: restriction endonuclease subunit S [Pantoea]KAJ9433919.1 restriction endonuclease subunit S [Pantoea sp. YR343]MRT22410.1 restriction endonuclease subunit S [Enterobacteriaceae bacterium RIT697]SFK60460.1 type I restriction enzyme, S subunit [Pantoea symbiotica]SFU96632.1 type I restriction enzyme, S subunit [Pantoea sp. YR525]
MTVEKLITDHIDTWSSALQTRSTAGRGSNGKIDLYGIKKLRELILELAVRGKLVQQDQNDEPASELLKRIAAEKADLVKQGKIKKQKLLPDISEDEKPFELPDGWEWVRLNDISEYIQRGKGPKYSEQGSVKVVSQKCVQWNGFKLEQSRWITDESIHSYTEDRFLKDGDVLWNSTGAGGTAGRCIYLPVVKEKLVVDSHVTLIRTIRDNGKFISNYISTYGIQNRFDPKHSNTLLSGTTNQAELNSSVVTSFLAPFPPQREQERINEKTAELMSLCDLLEQQSLTSHNAHQQLVETLLATLIDSQNVEELDENWARISQHFDTLFTTEASINSLKQTILQLAVMGRLVPQDPNDEPASELLKRIEQEKAQLVKEGKIKKQKPLPPISDEEKPFELPSGWEWIRFGEILAELKYGTSQKCDYLTNGYPVLRIPNVVGGEVSLEDMKFGKLSEHEVKELSLEKDDLIFIRSNGSLNIVGQCTLLRQDLVNHAYAGYLIRAKMHNNFVCAEYISLMTKAVLIRNQIEKPVRTTTGVKNINSSELSNLKLTFPPLSMQMVIVEKVNALLSFCESLKSRLNSAQQTQLHLADALTDAVLN